MPNCKDPIKEQERRDKISETSKGRTVSQETRDKISTAQKSGRWKDHIKKQKILKGKAPVSINFIMSQKGKPRSEEHKEKIRQSNIGKKRTEEQRKRLSESRKGNTSQKSIDTLINYNKSIKGKKMDDKRKEKLLSVVQSEEYRKKMSDALIGREITWGKKISETKIKQYGGISFYPYCPKFNKRFKERVRDYFRRTCLICGKNEKDNGEKHVVHHVNYDKMVCCNDVKPLFAILCRGCHAKTNHNRDYWENVLTNKLILEYNGVCF